MMIGDNLKTCWVLLHVVPWAGARVKLCDPLCACFFLGASHRFYHTLWPWEYELTSLNFLRTGETNHMRYFMSWHCPKYLFSVLNSTVQQKCILNHRWKVSLLKLIFIFNWKIMYICFYGVQGDLIIHVHTVTWLEQIR